MPALSSRRGRTRTPPRPPSAGPWPRAVTSGGPGGTPRERTAAPVQVLVLHGRSPRPRRAGSRAGPRMPSRAQVVVQVVPVRRPDPVAEPHPRIVHPRACRRQPGEHSLQRGAGRCGDGVGGLEVRRPGPSAHERINGSIVVARHHDHLTLGPEAPVPARAGPARPSPSSGEAGGASARWCRRAAPGARRPSPPPSPAGAPGSPELHDVAPARLAEVQIGDDQRAHGGAR